MDLAQVFTVLCFGAILYSLPTAQSLIVSVIDEYSCLSVSYLTLSTKLHFSIITYTVGGSGSVFVLIGLNVDGLKVLCLNGCPVRETLDYYEMNVKPSVSDFFHFVICDLMQYH